MNILILAAGLGTRMRPLTDTMPKALVPVGGKPLLQLLIEKIKTQCPDPHIVINIHHFGEQIVDFMEAHHDFGLPVSFSDERLELLDTGGAIKQAVPLFADQSVPVLIHNVDIMSNLDLQKVYELHQHRTQALATLVVSERKTSRYLLFNQDDRLCAWTNISTGEVRPQGVTVDTEACRRFAFSGIHVVSPRIVELMHEWPQRFSVIDFYLSVCGSESIKACLMPDLQLTDVGKYAEYQAMIK
ncbi:MAG: NTP transferase domain-containing protein [Bacteroidaceae bacterium]|nr:NTP transferase domain-containing protein [Bacteroidaceae bacterium]